MPHTKPNAPELPYLCARCGNNRALKLQDHLFRFRPIIGWIALPFGMTIEYVWKAPVYLCQACAYQIHRLQKMSRVPLFAGIILAGLALYLTFEYLDYGFGLLALALICFVSGFFVRAVLYTLGDPKTIKVNRRSLILDIPGYGAYDYTAYKHATRIK